jgi:integrase
LGATETQQQALAVVNPLEARGRACRSGDGSCRGRAAGRARRGDRGDLSPREDRDEDAPLFPGVGADKLRTAIGRACRAAGVPPFSPHDLRHRRISLLHRQGRSWAEIARFVGQRKLSLADTYTHVMSDGAELDYAAALVS